MPTFTIPVPPSVNDLYANRKTFIKGKSRQFGRILTKKHWAWRKECGQMLMVQRARPIPGRISFAIYIDETSLSDSSDIDGRIKAVLDALVHFEIIGGDSKRFVRDVSAHWSTAGEECWIVITLLA
jgi:Holliday junction resolvase RusA-like endonuclease